MHQRTRARRLATGAVSITLLLSGCADDSNASRADVAESEPGSREEVQPASTGPRSDDGSVAFGLCSALRAQANVMTDIANTAAADIHGKSPEDRYTSLLAGYDRGAAASNEFRDSLDALALPAVPELDGLVAEISAGADASAAEFADERARFVDDVGGAVADDDAGGRVSELFNSIEKANSLVEPVIVRYERVELKRAFLDEPECRYVIQPFVLDES